MAAMSAELPAAAMEEGGEEVGMAEPESSNNNNNVPSANNNNNNNNNNNSSGKGSSKKEGKLPPCSSISNNSFLWDPDVDGNVNVGLPLVPLMAPTEGPQEDGIPDITMLGDIPDLGPDLGDFGDFGEFLGSMMASREGGLESGPSLQSFRKVVTLARKAACSAPEGPQASDGDTNNNRPGGRFPASQAGPEPGSKALLLQHREPRDKAAGEAAAARGDPGGPRGAMSLLQPCPSCSPVPPAVPAPRRVELLPGPPGRLPPPGAAAPTARPR
jgi:hypothetical protein